MVFTKRRKMRSRKRMPCNFKKRSRKVGGAMSSPEQFTHHFIRALQQLSNHHTNTKHSKSVGGERKPTKTLKDRMSDAENIFDIVKSINDKNRLISKLFSEFEFPLDHSIVVSNKGHLPEHIETIQDYQKWLSIEDQLTNEGKRRFGVLRKLAYQLFTQEEVDNAVAIESVKNVEDTYLPPNTALDPFDDANKVDEEKHEPEDTITENPYVGKIKKYQETQSKEERIKYEQMALKEADQRQLLMILCGDIEAVMFFDKKGDMRHPEQIIKQTLFLLEPYNLTHSKMGAMAKHVYYYANLMWKYGYTVTMLMVSLMTLYLVGQFMMSCWYSLITNKVYHNIISWFLNKTSSMCIALLNTIMSLLSKHYKIKTKKNMFRGKTGREIVRLICMCGPPTMLWYILTTGKKDYNSNEELSIMMYGARTMLDRRKQLDAMSYLAQLSPGFFGEDMSTGITRGHLGLMKRVQKELLDIDKRIAEVQSDEIARIVKHYNESHRGTGISNRKLRLGNLINKYYWVSLNTEEVNLTLFRKELLADFADDMRSFHFLDAYGHPRNPTDVCKVFFIYWQRCEQSQVLPTVPYKGSGTLAQHMSDTPIEQLKTMRANMDDTKNIPNTWWRQHPFLYKKNQTRLPLTEALETEPSDVLSMFDKSNQEALRKHKGWTHRIASVGKQSLVERFHLSLKLLDEEYDLVRRKSHLTRKKALETGVGVKGVGWDERRDFMGYEKGLRLSATPGEHYDMAELEEDATEPTMQALGWVLYNAVVEVQNKSVDTDNELQISAVICRDAVKAWYEKIEMIDQLSIKASGGSYPVRARTQRRRRSQSLGKSRRESTPDRTIKNNVFDEKEWIVPSFLKRENWAKIQKIIKNKQEIYTQKINGLIDRKLFERLFEKMHNNNLLRLTLLDQMAKEGIIAQNLTALSAKAMEIAATDEVLARARLLNQEENQYKKDILEIELTDKKEARDAVGEIAQAEQDLKKEERAEEKAKREEQEAKREDQERLAKIERAEEEAKREDQERLAKIERAKEKATDKAKREKQERLAMEATKKKTELDLAKFAYDKLQKENERLTAEYKIESENINTNKDKRTKIEKEIEIQKQTKKTLEKKVSEYSREIGNIKNIQFDTLVESIKSNYNFAKRDAKKKILNLFIEKEYTISEFGNAVDELDPESSWTKILHSSTWRDKEKKRREELKKKLTDHYTNFLADAQDVKKRTDLRNEYVKTTNELDSAKLQLESSIKQNDALQKQIIQQNKKIKETSARKQKNDTEIDRIKNTQFSRKNIFF